MALFKIKRCLLLLIVLSSLVDTGICWWQRRRRVCSAVNCIVGNWGSWGNCKASCDSRGTRTRYRSKVRWESCGGLCNYALSSTTDCNGSCCRKDCVMNSWGSWGSCGGCGSACTQYRYRSVSKTPSCGGSSCPSLTTSGRICTSCACCAVDCLVNSWGGWGACNAPCSGTGNQLRYRTISRNSACGGTSCPSQKDSKSCIGGCCPVDCKMSAWSIWSACGTNCGTDSKWRSRTILTSPSCGGKACSYTTSETTSCKSYVKINCQVNAWSSYGTCQPTNGKCGSGTQSRSRSIAVNAYCGGTSCSNYPLTSSRPCSAGCCPVDCQVGLWSSWSSCSTSCGSGSQSRTRSVTRSSSCGGKSCPSTKETKSCYYNLQRPCQVSSWSAYSTCTNDCGVGTQTRTRTITTVALCGGSCPSLSQTTSCTVYANKDCQVTAWSSWNSCSKKCSTGQQYRYRTVTQQKYCKGNVCPSLSDTKPCGLVNGGCQHNCNNGVCSCKTGYLLGSNGKSCSPRSCGPPSIKYCPSGTTYGTTCKYPAFSCTGTTYQQTCSVSCPSGYAVKNAPSTMQCLSSGAWTSYQTTYCRRINDPPSKVSLSNSVVNENVASGTVVGSLSSTDPNVGDSHTYGLLNSAGGKFTLSGTSLKIAFRPDYETQPHTYTVKVRSTDKKGLYRDETFTISILNVNEPPVSVSISNAVVNENSNKGTTVGTLSTSDPETNQKHTYTLVDSAGGRFSLNGDKVQVAVSNVRCLAEGGSRCVLNYEASRSHNIVVRSTDNGSPPKLKDVTLTITLRDVNDKPRGLKLSGYTLYENSLVGTIIGTLSSTDEDPGQKSTYTLTDDAGGRFAISNGNKVVRKTSTGIDYETTTSYKVTVAVQDNGTPKLTLTKQFTIDVLNNNEPPVTIDFTSTDGQLSFTTNNPRVNENSVVQTVVGTLVAYDPDANQKLSFKLDDTAGGKFALDSNNAVCTVSYIAGIKTKCSLAVVVNGTLDHEADASHTIVVRVTDQNNLFKTKKVSISVVDVNDKPKDIVFVGGQPSVNENRNNALVGAFKTTDDDSTNKHTYSLVDSAGGKFVISGDSLMTSASANINYEVSKQLNIVVRSTDNGAPPLSVDKAFTVTVTDVNESPTSVSLTVSSIDENSALDAVVGTLRTVDPDNSKTVRQSHTYALLDSANGRFKIVGGVVKVAASNKKCLQVGGGECKLDYETAKSHRILVRSTDNGNPPLQSDFNLTISLNDINDRPRSLSISDYKVKENEEIGTLVGIVRASDEDRGQTLTYTLTDNDGGRFRLKGNRLEKAKKANYETKTSHKVTVQVSDNGSPSLSMTKTFTIEVLDVNDAPVTIIFKSTAGQQTFADNNPKINENSGKSTVVGTLEAQDEDDAQTITFTLDDDDGGRFTVGSAATVQCTSATKITGINTVCTTKVLVSGTLNYEGNVKHTIIVRATDKGGKFKTAKFTIQVVDINDKPTDIQLAGGNPEVKENLNNAVVGELKTSDEDSSQSHTYKLLNSAGGRFVVVNREVRVSKNASLDYESGSRYTIQVEATDDGSPRLSVSKSFVVRVLDVNEKPTRIDISKNEVNENSPLDTVVGKVSTIDPDNSQSSRQSFKYELLDTASGRFKVDGDTIKVAVANTDCLALGGTFCSLNYEAQRQHDITVRATDSGVPSLSVDVKLTITLVNVNDQPRDLDLSNNRVLENDPVNTTVGVLSSTDEDKDQSRSYSLADDDNGRFKVVGNKLQKAKVANYEVATTHSIVVVVQDNGTTPLKMSRTFVIEVADVNEAPVNISFVDKSTFLSYSDNMPRVPENSLVGTVVGTVEAIDYDANDTLSFRLDDDSNGMFALGNSGQASCKTVFDKPEVNTYCSLPIVVAGSLNYEEFSKHYITIRVTDQEGMFRANRFGIDIVDVNDVPHDIELSLSSVRENLNNRLIGAFTTQDQDVAQQHTYTLVNNPGDKFTVKNNQLFTSVTANLDYETQQTYNLTVRSTDSGVPAQYLEENFIISVTDVNEVPSLIRISNSKVQENSPSDTLVGILTVEDPDNLGPKGVWQTHACAAVVNAGGRFVVDSDAVKVANADINYEASANLSIVVRCTDSGNPSLFRDEAFVVTVIDENELPVGLNMSGGTVAENSAPQVVATFSTQDPDNEFYNKQSFVYAIVVQPQGFPFVISGNELKTTVSLDYEQRQSWQVSVRSTDSGGLSIERIFQVNVIDVNDRPSGISLAGTASVPENSPILTYVGQITTTDEDFNQTFSYSLLNVVPSLNRRQAFVLDPTTGQLSVGTDELDYEKTSQYTLKIKTTDSGVPSYTYTGSVVVTVTDVNEPPSNISLNGSKITENSAINTSVGVLTVTDPDNEFIARQKLQCSVVNEATEPFTVQNKFTLVVSNSVDFEEQQFHYLGVRCIDDGSPPLYVEKQFRIQVMDINESPANVGLSSEAIEENEEAGSLVGIAVCQDPDNEGRWVQNITYGIVESDVPFAISGTQVVSTMKFNFENTSSYVFHLTAADTGTPRKATAVKITVSILDVNDRPTFVGLSSQGVRENSPGGTHVGWLHTNDEDRNQSHTYSIIAQIDSQGLFAINENALIVASGAQLDFEQEAQHIIVIESTDNGTPPLSVQNSIIVHVINVNEKPTDIVSYNVIEINENSRPGTWIADLTVVDEDVNQTHTCSLLNGTQYFTLTDGDHPKILVSQSAEIDYEKVADIWVNIKCSDSGNPPLSVHHSFHVQVIDVNEPPTEIILNGSRYLKEDIPVGHAIAKVSVRDEDVGQSYTYAVVGQMSAAFRVDNSKRQLIVSRPIYLDFESLRRNEINITIAVSDDGFPPLSYNQTFTFVIINVNEPPIGITISGGGSVAENAIPGQSVGTVSSRNDETGQSVTYRILSVDGNPNSTQFYLQNEGNLTYLYCNATLDYGNQSSFLVEIEATDNGDPPSSSIETVTIIVLATDPCALGTAGCSVYANCTRLSPSTSRCSCIDGYGGDGTICRNIDECSSVRPDSSGSISLCDKGKCVDGIGEYTCNCDPGYTGRDCSQAIDECGSNPCREGKCVDLANAYTCQCYEGFTGANCEENINDCAVSLCGNGTCIDGVDDYRCECPEGVKGDHCSFSSSACKMESCKDSHCIPKSHDGNQITMVDVDSERKDLPPVALKPVTGSDIAYHSMSTSPFLCVPDNYIVAIKFPASLKAGSKPFLDDWERHLQKDLLVTIPAQTGNEIGSFSVPISYVYITQSHLESDGSATVYFVVVVNDEAVTPYDVLIGLNKNCLNITSLSHPDEICRSVSDALAHTPTIRPPQEKKNVPGGIGGSKSTQTKGIGSEILWPVIGSLAAFTIIVALVLFARWYWAGRRLQAIRQSYDFQNAYGSDDGIDVDPTSGLFQEGVTEESRNMEFNNPSYDAVGMGMKRNPLYRQGDDTAPNYSHVREEVSVGDILNPIYKSSTATTIENVLYQQSEDMSQQFAGGIQENLYQTIQDDENGEERLGSQL